MSVTFQPLGNGYFEVPNRAYNPSEPEDPIYNPRMLLEQIFPYVNLSNINAGIMLRFIGHYNEDLCGQVKLAELDEFIIKINKLEKETTDDYTKKFLIRLDRIARICKEIKAALVWS